MENLNQLLDQVLRPGTFAMAIGVVIATFFIKRVAELLFPKLKTKKVLSDTPNDNPKELMQVQTYENRISLWWNDVVLYAIPVLIGMSLGYCSSDFLHGAANEHLGSRLMWSAGVAWFSSFFYKIFRKVVLQKTGVDIQPGPVSIPPPGAGT